MKPAQECPAQQQRSSSASVLGGAKRRDASSIQMKGAKNDAGSPADTELCRDKNIRLLFYGRDFSVFCDFPPLAACQEKFRHINTWNGD